MSGKTKEKAALASLGSLMAEQNPMQLQVLMTTLALANTESQALISDVLMGSGPVGTMAKGDPMGAVDAFQEVGKSLARNPMALMNANLELMQGWMKLWQEMATEAMGTPAAPETDKRFADPEWQTNPGFKFIRKAYDVNRNWLMGLADHAPDLPDNIHLRAKFFTQQLTDTLSPTNYLGSNPQALRAFLESGGESVLNGIRLARADVKKAGGKLHISQTDETPFEIGKNIATAPGKVVFRNDLIELIQYAPTQEETYSRPLLIFPPWINKFYILDLQPANSLIRWLSEQGFTVFVCSWINPDLDKAGYGFDDYLEKGVYRAVEKTLEQAGTDRLNAVGYCIGGTLLGAGLAHMAAKGDKRIAAATFFAAQHDFAEAGDLLLFTDEHWIAEIERQMDAAGGVLPGAAMADTFNALRSNDLIWSFFISNYLLGKDPPAFDLLFWNADQTRMPKTLHLAYLRQMYGANALARGAFQIGGLTADLSKVKIPLYFQASREDHIAPMNSVYRSAKLFGGKDVTFTLAGSGHIAGVINAPTAKKYQHWTNTALPATLAEWQAGAVENPGSWWEHWAKWLRARSGDPIPSRDPAAGPLKPLEPAPGSYVKVTS